MAIYAYPLILKEHYAAFRQIVSDLPETYEAWKAALDKRKGEDRISHEAPGGSFDSVDVRIDGGAFLGYCEKKAEAPTVSMLYRFAFDNQN